MKKKAFAAVAAKCSFHFVSEHRNGDNILGNLMDTRHALALYDPGLCYLLLLISFKEHSEKMAKWMYRVCTLKDT